MKLSHLQENNRRWATETVARDPEFFKRLTQQQSPEYLWIGCADSRVPANEIVDLLPGELFVHRNVANVVVHTVLNCLSVLQYAVDVLKVKHVIVCGHYGCGGVIAAHQNLRLGLINNWLRHIQDVEYKHRDHLATLESEEAKGSRLCELNVVEQVVNVSQTTVVESAWDRGQDLTVHGWIYGVADGIVRDLNMSMNADNKIEPMWQRAVSMLHDSPPV